MEAETSIDICPLCEELGRTGKLSLKQINALEALYVCNNSKCPYPVGMSAETVHRPVKELLDPSEEKEQSVPSNEDASNMLLEVPMIQFDSELDELLQNFLDEQV